MRLAKPLFSDKRKRPLTKKGISTNIKNISSGMPTDMSTESMTPSSDMSASTFKKGGVAKGCGKIMSDKKKVTKYY